MDARALIVDNAVRYHDAVIRYNEYAESIKHADPTTVDMASGLMIWRELIEAGVVYIEELEGRLEDA